MDNTKSVFLNPNFSFLEHEKHRYGYMASQDFPMAFMSVSEGLEEVLNDFRTPQTVSDYLVKNYEDRQEDLSDFLHFLTEHGVLVEEGYQQPRFDQTGTGVPNAITFLPTTQCNLGCNYCYAEAGDHSIQELPIDVAETAIRRLVEMQPDDCKVLSVGFLGGGEPSLRFDLVKRSVELFYELAQARGIKTKVNMVTNGAFTESFLNWALENDVQFSFSLDGPADLQNLQRPLRSGAPSYDRIIKNIKRVAEERGPVSIRATVTRQGMDRLREIVEHAIEIGAGSVHLQPLSDEAGRAKLMTRSQYAMDGKYFVDKFLDIYPWALKKGVRLFTTGLLCLRPGNSKYCGAPSPNLMVAPSGELTACPEYCESHRSGADNFIYGKVGDKDFEYKEEVVVKLQERRGDTIKDCQNCFIRDQCGGGCMASAYDHTHDAFGKDISTCSSYQEMGRRFISAIADERLIPDSSSWLPRKKKCDSQGVQGNVVTMIPETSHLRYSPKYKPIAQFLQKGQPAFSLAADSHL